MFKRKLQQAGIENTKLSLHSLHAGGVTLAAESGVQERLYKAHGRWKSDAVKAYVTESLENQLSVSQDMNM